MVFSYQLNPFKVLKFNSSLKVNDVESHIPKTLICVM